MNKIVTKYLKYLLPVVFIAYYSSITFCLHVHVENGTTIIHSHPFKKATDGISHTHASLAEIELFYELSHIYTDTKIFLSSIDLDFYAWPIYEVTRDVISAASCFSGEDQLSLRAPPVVVCL